MTRRYRWYALGLLAAINLLNYIDRNVIFALFEPIKRDLALTDAQLGWLGLGLHLRLLGRRAAVRRAQRLRSRRAVIAGGVTVWSAFTFLSGLVKSFGQLFTCRAAVGVGEAAYGPAAASMVADYFPGPRPRDGDGDPRVGGRARRRARTAAGRVPRGHLRLARGVHDGRRAGIRLRGSGGAAPDPARAPATLTVRSFLRDFHIGAAAVIRNLWPLIAGVALGAGAAYWLTGTMAPTRSSTWRPSAPPWRSGLAFTILRWVRRDTGRRRRCVALRQRHHRRVRRHRARGRSGAPHPDAGLHLRGRARMISFGTNGIVGWGPTFVSRELGLSAAEAAALLGKWGLICGHRGDAVRRRSRRLAPPPLRRPAGCSRWRSGLLTRRAARGLAAHHPRSGAVPGGVRRRVLLSLVVQRPDHRGDLRRRAAADQRDRGRSVPAVHSPGRRRDRAAAGGDAVGSVRPGPGGAPAAAGGDRRRAGGARVRCALLAPTWPGSRSTRPGSSGRLGDAGPTARCGRPDPSAPRTSPRPAPDRPIGSPPMAQCFR